MNIIGLVNTHIHWVTTEEAVELASSPEFISIDKYPVEVKIHEGEVGCLANTIKGTNLMFVLGRFGIL